MSYHLLELVQKLGCPRVLVLGDAILDRYIWGDAERVSQEAPVILLRADRDESRLGGAANVAQMVRGLQAEVTLATVLGDDFDGRFVQRELQAAQIHASAVIIDPDRPTTVKERFIGRAQNRHPHQMLRVDREMREPLSASRQDHLLDVLLPQVATHQAVLISDYGKGVCTPEVLHEVISEARLRGIPVVVDPRPGQDYSVYHGATAITPNRLETKLATGREIRCPDDAFRAGQELCRMLGLEYAFITLDSDGIVLVYPDGRGHLLPTRKRQVYDITGAGDMVLATIGVGLAEQVPPIEIGQLANIAGGLEVEKIGVVPITREEMLADLLAHARRSPDKLCTLDEAERHLSARRKLGQKIVFTNGCFDMLHIGHVTYLQEAAREGDCLVVAINSDASVRSLNKGPERPIFPQAQRAAMLAALECVDYVLIFEEATPHTVLSRLRPDLLVKGGTYHPESIVGREIVESYGGRVRPLGEIPGVSTTNIIAALRASLPAAVDASADVPIGTPSITPVAAERANTATVPAPHFLAGEDSRALAGDSGSASNAQNSP